MTQHQNNTGSLTLSQQNSNPYITFVDMELLWGNTGICRYLQMQHEIIWTHAFRFCVLASSAVSCEKIKTDLTTEKYDARAVSRWCPNLNY